MAMAYTSKMNGECGPCFGTGSGGTHGGVCKACTGTGKSDVCPDCEGMCYLKPSSVSSEEWEQHKQEAEKDAQEAYNRYDVATVKECKIQNLVYEVKEGCEESYTKLMLCSRRKDYISMHGLGTDENECPRCDGEGIASAPSKDRFVLKNPPFYWVK